jgi:hypothetical protein
MEGFDFQETTPSLTELIIHNVITPNNLDDKNNVLYIENIEFYQENSVTLCDRWCSVIKSWKNFNNYTSTNPTQSDFDFSQLSNGNYICFVEYIDPQNSEKRKAKPQMITVLK